MYVYCIYAFERNTRTCCILMKILKKKKKDPIPTTIDWFNFFAYPKNLNLTKNLILILFFSYLFTNLQISTTMRVHPVASKRSLTMRDGFESPTDGNVPKKLRKLPHVFSKVLELPIGSDADVAVEDGLESIRFIAKIEVDGENVVNGVRAHAVEIHPGVTKIVVRNGEGDVELLLDQLNIDTWRFRLPRSSQPELARAVFVDGELTVTVPKGGQRDFDDGRDVWHGGSRLVLVQ